MVFANDTADALESAVWLANTAETPDTLVTVDDLTDYYEQFEYSGRRPTAKDLAPVRAIRSRLREIFTATRDGAVPLVNSVLSEAGALPQLVRHDGLDWHLHAVTDDRPFAERVLVETAMAMTDVIRADEMSRFQVCAGTDCDGIVLDLSRNRSRKFCSPACTNRAAVAAYRARRG